MFKGYTGGSRMACVGGLGVIAGACVKLLHAVAPGGLWSQRAEAAQLRHPWVLGTARYLGPAAPT